ncbi:MAG: hypothetical protein AAGF19_06480 [Pseudomonadota bacterium]
MASTATEPVMTETKPTLLGGLEAPLSVKIRRRLSPREHIIGLQANKLAKDVLHTVDLVGLNELKRGARKKVDQVIDLKYFNSEGYMPYSMKRAVRLGLQACNNKQILDLGTGFGYFPYVCEFFGHGAMATDLPGVTLYDEVTEFLGIKKRHHTVLPFEPLPQFPTRFDMVTGFLVAFNRPNTDDEWGAKEWAFFIEDVFDNQLKDGGMLALELNVIDRFNSWYSPDTLALFRKYGTVDGDRVTLTRR